MLIEEKIFYAACLVTGISPERLAAEQRATREFLSKKWHDSKQTDFSIYEGEPYLIELLHCWKEYSGPSLERAVHRLFGIRGTTLDYQGGIGMSTAMLAMLLPDTDHFVYPGSRAHCEFAEKLFKKLVLKNAHVADDLFEVDCVLAQETFEHYNTPVTEVEKLLNECKPTYFFEASTFEYSKPAGHFIHDPNVRNEFNDKIAELGYSVKFRDHAFDEKFVNRKPEVQLPTLWCKK